MTELTLDQALAIAKAALAHARAGDFKPMAVAVLDHRGSLKAALSEDGSPPARVEVARGKANAAFQLGYGGRALSARAEASPAFIINISPIVGGVIPALGAAVIRAADGRIVGAVGASGDSGENDEAAVIAGCASVGLTGDPGQG